MSRLVEQARDAVGELNDREIDVLVRRVASDSPETLDSLARLHGVTRERVRQVENKLVARLANRVNWAQALAVVQGLEWDVVRVESVAVELSELAELEPRSRVSILRLAERVAGTFEVSGGWLARPTLQVRVEASRAIVKSHGLGDDWSLSRFECVKPSDRDEWLTFVGASALHGHAFVGAISLQERAYLVLKAVGEPSKSDEIAALVGADRSVRSLKNALSIDERFARVDRDRWALVEWGIAPYVSLRDAIARAVEQAGGSIRLSRLVKDMVSTYSVTERSVFAYATAPPFKLQEGMVFVEKGGRRPYRKTPLQTKALYRRPSSWCIRVELTGEHARGSGSRVPSGLVAAFGMGYGQVLKFSSPLGEQELSTAGKQPGTGSVKRFIDAAGLSVGQTCFLVFRDDFTFDIEVVALDAKTGLSRAASLCAIAGDDPTSIEDFARAITAPPSTNRARLIELFRDRGDYEVAGLLTAAEL